MFIRRSRVRSKVGNRFILFGVPSVSLFAIGFVRDRSDD